MKPLGDKHTSTCLPTGTSPALKQRLIDTLLDEDISLIAVSLSRLGWLE
jgi:hypothetical protein